MHPACAGVPAKKKAPWAWMVVGGAALLSLAVLAGLKPTRSRPGSSPTAASFDPAECHYLDAEGLRTTGWKFHGVTVENDDWGCVAQPKVLGWSAPNDVSYFVDGTAERVQKVKVELNVFNRATPQRDHEHLANLAEIVYGHAMGAALPKDVRAAILAGRSLEKPIDGRRVSVHREDWPTGKGYEIGVIISR